VTYLEKARELRPDLENADIWWQCPDDFDLESENSDCPREGSITMTCKECWNREMPVEVENE